MKKFAKLLFEIFLAPRLAHKWHCKFRSVLQFVRADALIQTEISRLYRICRDRDKYCPDPKDELEFRGEENGTPQF